MLPNAPALTVRRLRARALALLQEADAAPIDARRARAERHADVRLYDCPFDGMATLAADLPTDVAAACSAFIDELARMLEADGDPRPIGQLRTRVYADLLQRPGETGRPPVTAHLQVIATLGALAGRSTEAGAVNGLPITAAHLRELLTQLDGLGVRAPEGGSVTLTLVDDDGTLRATSTLDQLDQLGRLAGRGCPDHPDTDTDCECAVLDRPAAVERCEPSAAQRRFVRTRDRTCRFPTCGQRVGWADADHVVPHAPGGTTDCADLCCLCRSHHRLKTFARGWRFHMTADGILTVTAPSGITRTTRPPGVRPPLAEPDPPPAGTGPPPPADPADDPPPF
ncbi:HNH endonuclease signature motif containing protein [Geodermatophilus sp. SYSU D01180]